MIESAYTKKMFQQVNVNECWNRLFVSPSQAICGFRFQVITQSVFYFYFYWKCKQFILVNIYLNWKPTNGEYQHNDDDHPCNPPFPFPVYSGPYSDLRPIVIGFFGVRVRFFRCCYCRFSWWYYCCHSRLFNNVNQNYSWSWVDCCWDCVVKSVKR